MRFLLSQDTSTGGGLYSSNCDPELTNCILWSNSEEQIYVSSGTPVVRYSDIQGGWSGTGNIDTDPLLGAPGYHLSADSPCIDAADNTAVPADTMDLDDDDDLDEPIPLDLAGHPRFVDDLATQDTGNPSAEVPPVSADYLAKSKTETGAANAVMAVLLDYRAYDTLGEATVIFVSILGAYAMLRHVGRKREELVP